MGNGGSGEGVPPLGRERQRTALEDARKLPEHPNLATALDPAPISQRVDQETGSDGVSADSSSPTRAASPASAPVPRFATGGDFQNVPGAIQCKESSDDIKPGGITGTISPELGVRCERTVQQSAAASGKSAAPLPKAVPPEVEQPNVATKELPETGGIGAALLALPGEGVLLIGGPLIREICR